ncbi:MAG: STAS domain-containing protein [Polyangiaceae bacterium]
MTANELTLAKQKLAEKRTQLEVRRKMLDELFHHSSDGVVIFRPDGSSDVNELGMQMFLTPTAADPNWMESWQFVDLSTNTPKAASDLGVLRVLRGLPGGYEENAIHVPGSDPLYLANDVGPLPGGGAISVFRDIGARVRLERELAAQQERLAAREQEHKVLIARLRAALDELATPVLRVANGVLVMPLIGVIDSQRATLIVERVLDDVVREKASYVVVDVTGVEVLDTTTADHLAKLSRAVALLGAKCLLSGVQPEVAQTLVALGVKLDTLVPHRNLAHALRSCLEGGGRARSRPATPTRSVNPSSKREAKR